MPTHKLRALPPPSHLSRSLLLSNDRIGKIDTCIGCTTDWVEFIITKPMWWLILFVSRTLSPSSSHSRRKKTTTTTAKFHSVYKLISNWEFSICFCVENFHLASVWFCLSLSFSFLFVRYLNLPLVALIATHLHSGWQ